MKNDGRHMGGCFMSPCRGTTKAKAQCCNILSDWTT